MVKVITQQFKGRTPAKMKSTAAADAMVSGVNQLTDQGLKMYEDHEKSKYANNVVKTEREIIEGQDALNDKFVRDGNIEAYRKGNFDLIDKKMSSLDDTVGLKSIKDQLTLQTEKIKNSILEETFTKENSIIADRNIREFNRDLNVMLNQVHKNTSDATLNSKITTLDVIGPAKMGAEKWKQVRFETKSGIYFQHGLGKVQSGNYVPVKRKINNGYYDDKLTPTQISQLQTAVGTLERTKVEKQNGFIKDIKVRNASGIITTEQEYNATKKMLSSGALTGDQELFAEMLTTGNNIDLFNGIGTMNPNLINEYMNAKIDEGNKNLPKGQEKRGGITIRKDVAVSPNFLRGLKVPETSQKAKLFNDHLETVISAREKEISKDSMNTYKNTFANDWNEASAEDYASGNMTAIKDDYYNYMDSQHVMQEWSDVKGNAKTEDSAISIASKLDSIGDRDLAGMQAQNMYKNIVSATNEDYANQVFSDIDSKAGTSYLGLALSGDKNVPSSVTLGKSDAAKGILSTNDNSVINEVINNNGYYGSMQGKNRILVDQKTDILRKILPDYIKGEKLKGNLEGDIRKKDVDKAIEQVLGAKKVDTTGLFGQSIRSRSYDYSRGKRDKKNIESRAILDSVKSKNRILPDEDSFQDVYVDKDVDNVMIEHAFAKFQDFVEVTNRDGTKTILGDSNNYSDIVPSYSTDSTRGLSGGRTEQEADPDDLVFVNVGSSKTRFQVFVNKDGENIPTFIPNKYKDGKYKTQPYIVNLSKPLGSVK